MAHFLFIDESGYDSGPSPYGVLGGVAIEDRDVWNLIKAMQDAELRYFGTRYSFGQAELKAKKLISAQVFRQAGKVGEIAFAERTELAKGCIEHGAGAPPRAIAALAQAKLAYVREVLEICARFRCRAFASVVDKNSPSPGTDHLISGKTTHTFLSDSSISWKIWGSGLSASLCSMSLKRSKAIFW